MKIRNILNEKCEFYAKDMWEIYTNKGKLDLEGIKKDFSYIAENEEICLKSEIVTNKNGVINRKDSITNKSTDELYINSAFSRFLFNGGEYEVYTQANSWQNESHGLWQPINTSIVASCNSIRTCEGATPFIALWNEQTHRGMVFHLFPESAWKMEINKIFLYGYNSAIEVKIGFENKDLNLELKKGESLDFPEILCYSFDNKLDMDCYKLHRYLNEKYPRQELPVIYNSWLSDFDNISYEKLVRQAEIASKLGFEYFAIDAGWFGSEEKRWSSAIGDWKENETGKLKGRLKDVSEEVRRLGMKFGIWFEPERAVDGADCLLEHREYYIEEGDSFFLDFTNDDALEYVLDIMCETIERCNIEYVKFDANADMRIDYRRTAFVDYHKGYKKFIKKLKERIPNLYIEGCAGGGMKMDLSNLKMVGSFWFTDNQSPFEGLEIYKNTILRMIPQAIDKIATIKSIQGIIETYTGETDLLISSNNATWSDFKALDKSFLFGFLSATPIEFSCDLTAISEKTFNDVKGFIEKFKAEREFWKNVECRILTDTETMLTLQYNDKNFKKIKIFVYSLRVLQDSVTVYPIIDDGTYKIKGENKFYDNDGIETPVEQYTVNIIELDKI